MYDIENLVAVIQASGLVDRIKAELNKTTGRPRKLTVLALIVGIAANLDEHGKVRLYKVHRFLNHLTPEQHAALGLASPPQLTDDNVSYLWRRITKALSPTDPTDSDQVAISVGLLDELSDALLAETLVGMDLTARVVMDDTGIETWGRRRGATNEELAQQPRNGRRRDRDARIGHRTPTALNPTEYLHGYQCLAVGRMEGRNVVEAIRVRPANDAPAPAGIDLLRELVASRENGQQVPITSVVADRGFTYAKTENWATPLRHLGIENIQDINAGDRRYLPSTKGYDIIDGHPFCHKMPDQLRDVKRPANLTVKPLPANATKEEREAHAKRVRELQDFKAWYEESEKYAFERHGKTSGGVRYSCPAKVGKVVCAGCPFQVDPDDDAPIIEEPPRMPKAQLRDELPACAQQTIVVPWEANEKHRQPHRVGSPEWFKVFTRRTRIEGIFSAARTQGGLNKGWICVLGQVKTHLMTMLLFAVRNLNRRNEDGFIHPART